MKRRLVRQDDAISDDDVVVVRGGELDPEILRTDARRNHSIYGTYAISVFALREATLEELAQKPPLVRFARLTLMRVGEIRSAGLRLEATGRSRTHFSVVLKDLNDGVAALCRCPHEIIANPYHEREMDDELDLVADLNAQDDDGCGWSTLSDAQHPDRVRPGAMLLAGNRLGRAVVRVVAVDEDGQIHFTVLPGSVEKNRHLLGSGTA